MVGNCLASEFKKVCEDFISKNGIVNIALSGGNTPKVFFSILAKDYKDKIKWDNVNFYWVDERCVAPDSVDNNYGMTLEILFNNIKIPPKNINRIFGENIPYIEAERYSRILRENLPSKNFLPKFNLIILGIGEDGHIASIFPNQMELLNSDKLCEVAVHPSSEQKRITLTGKVLNNAEVIIFLVTGKEKAWVVKDIIEKTDNSNQYPAGFIKTTNGIIKWYLDIEAASYLIKNNFHTGN